MEFKPTHLVTFWNIPCYYNELTGDLAGTNWLYDDLLEIAVYLDRKLPSSWDGFKLKIIKEL